MSCLVVACTDDSAFTGDQASGATPAQGADTGATSEPATDPPGVLFVQRAESGTTTIDADGSATVVLSDVDEETVWFEDRPGRGAGRTPTGDFVGSWASAGFDDDAPNGSLEVVGTDGTRSNHVVELHAPRWDADARTLTYSVSSNGEATLPAEFGASSLFIDGANPIQAVASTYQPVTLRFENVQPGQGVGVLLAGKGGSEGVVLQRRIDEHQLHDVRAGPSRSAPPQGRHGDGSSHARRHWPEDVQTAAVPGRRRQHLGVHHVVDLGRGSRGVRRAPLPGPSATRVGTHGLQVEPQLRTRQPSDRDDRRISVVAVGRF